MMDSFINKVSEILASRHPKSTDFVVVLPSKRAKRYLMESVAKAYQKPIYAPEVYTIDEYIRKHTTEQILDKTRQQFVLFNLVKGMPKYKDLTFEEFLNWGPVVLSDYDELNRYLLDTQQVFRNLTSIKELESWDLEEGKSLSISQQKFMEFWDSLPAMFERFSTYLSTHNQTTMGLAVRRLAESNLDFKDKKHHYFIGFNALSKAELTMVKKFILAKSGNFWVNGDVFYFENKQHEAGSFLRKTHDFLDIKTPSFLENDLKEGVKKIDIIECSQITGQVKVLATELLNNYDSESSTLVLLADESLVSSVIKNLPEKIKTANVTVGLPLKQTPIKSWVDLIFSIQENKERFKTTSAYYKDILLFSHHTLITSWLSIDGQQDLARWELQMIKKNKVFQSTSALNFPNQLQDMITILYTDWAGDFSLAIKLIRQLNQMITGNLGVDFEFEKQILLTFDQSLLAFENLVHEGLPAMNRKTFKSLMTQHWANESIAFHGNPTSGIQIMGLLESRMLDFDTIYFLGMNEGNLPPTNPIDSIIPMDLRRGLGLPTPREKQGIFAHHFYRLLHKAKKVVITYSSGGDTFKQSEASRYIVQLERELKRLNPNIEMSKSFYATGFPSADQLNASVIKKYDELTNQLDRYFGKFVSATALKAYLNCPLDFYYKYIAEFGEEENIQPDLESHKMGSFIHKTLEILYEPFAERNQIGEIKPIAPSPILASDVQAMLLAYPDILKKVFLSELYNDQSLLDTGKNWLTFKVASELVKNTLNNDIEWINSAPYPVYIVQIEAKMSAQFSAKKQSGPDQILTLYGIIDRIDRCGDKYRIVDYKSGKVEDKDVKYAVGKSAEEPFRKVKHLLQLAVYAYLFEKNMGQYPNETGIYALQQKEGAFKRLELGETLYPEFLSQFEETIQTVINEVYDLSLPIKHNSEASYCKYCE